MIAAPDWEREIRELHDFFGAWFCGEIPDEDDAFVRCGAVLDPDFSMVTPRGKALSRDDVLSGIRDGHGGGARRIWIEAPILVFETPAIVTARYQEWQQQGGDPEGRLSTVVFARDETKPNGLRWMTVHETWLEAPTRWSGADPLAGP